MVIIGYATEQEDKIPESDICKCEVFCICNDCEIGNSVCMADGAPKQAVIILCYSCESKNYYQ